MCEYCENNQKLELENPVCGSCGISINGNEIEIAINYEVAFATINYCPICSRNLKERSNEL